MRTIVMFDLPTYTLNDLREYRKFRKYLISSGFIMLQESVYTKLAINPIVTEQVKKGLRQHMPKDGSVFVLTVTEKQFNSMELLVGTRNSKYCQSDKRLIEL